MKEVFTLKKVVVLMLAGILIITSVFAACSKTADDETTAQGLQANAEEVELTTEPVTDENGNTVAAEEVGDEGDETLATNPTEKGTATTKKGVPMTESDEIYEPDDQQEVPSVTDTGNEVNFSEEDQLIIQSMLEVPYLYQASYENADGVPIELATHVAIWMAEHEGSTRKVYPSSPVVLNLFKYFGQTVVNFKAQCNEYAEKSSAPIKYNSKDDTFTISEFTSKKQSVKITKIEDLGKNNYYRVTASVSGCDKKKVVAVIQKNRLDVSLGFSIKALKWS